MAELPGTPIELEPPEEQLEASPEAPDDDISAGYEAYRRQVDEYHDPYNVGVREHQVMSATVKPQVMRDLEEAREQAQQRGFLPDTVRQDDKGRFSARDEEGNEFIIGVSPRDEDEPLEPQERFRRATRGEATAETPRPPIGDPEEIAKGVLDVAAGAVDLARDLPDAITRGVVSGGAEALHLAGVLSDDDIARFRKMQESVREFTPAGAELTELLGSFMLPGGALFGVFKAAKLGTVTAGMLAEGITAAITQNPKLVDVAALIPKDAEGIGGELRDLLAIDPDDERFEKAAKVFAQNAGLAGVFFALLPVFKIAAKAAKAAKAAASKVVKPGSAAVVAISEVELADPVLSQPGVGRPDAEPPVQVAQLGSLLLKAQKVFRKRLPGQPPRPKGPVLTEAEVTEMRRALDDPAYKSGDELTDFNYENFDTTEDIDRLMQTIMDQHREAGTVVKRGVQTRADTEFLADHVGMTPEKLLNRRTGQAYNDAELVAAKSMVTGALRRLKTLHAAAVASDSTENLINLRRHAAITGAMLLQFKGAQTEAGRALNALKGTAKTKIAREAEINDLLLASGGRHTNERFVEMVGEIVDQGSDVELARFMANSRRATTVDMLFEAWINSLLGSPATHIVNAGSNGAIQLVIGSERWLAATYGAGERAITGSRRGITFREAAAHTMGAVKGIELGFRMMLRSFRTGEPASVTLGKGAETVAKLDLGRRRAITAENINRLPLARAISPELLKEGGAMARIVDFIAEYYYRGPGRLLVASDAFFRGPAYAAELNALAVREVFETGLTGKAAVARRAEIIADPEFNAPQIHLDSVDAARYATLTTPPGPVAAGIRQALDAELFAVPIGRVIVPFFNVINNIVKFPLERIPVLSLGSRRIRDELMGADPAKRQMVLGRWTAGAGALAVSSFFASQGLITGRQTDNPRMRAILRIQGKQQYSIMVPWTRIDPENRFKGVFHDGKDRFYSFRRTQPVGTFLAIAADTQTALAYTTDPAEREALVTAAIAAVAPYMSEQTFFTGIAQFMDAVNPQHAYGDSKIDAMGRWLSQLVASSPGALLGPLAPGTPLQGMLRRTFDPVRRSQRPNPHETPEYRIWERTINRIWARTPGLADNLPEEPNLWGEPILFEGGLGPDIVTPIYTHDLTYSTERLRKAGLPDRVWKNLDFVGLQIGGELTEKQFKAFVGIVGINGELERLGMPISKPLPIFDGIHLNPWQRTEYIKLAGNELKTEITLPNGKTVPNVGLKDALELIVRTKEYMGAPDDPDIAGSKHDVIRKAVFQYRRAARQVMKQRHPDLFKAIVTKQSGGDPLPILRGQRSGPPVAPLDTPSGAPLELPHAQ